MAIKGASHSEKKFYSSSKDKNKQPPTKVVIRRLPPDMALDTFREQVAPLPDHDYLWFVAADPGLAPHSFSRAYINFLHMDDIITFRDRFDGYVFVDKEGFEFPAVVEFAPYQRTPRRRSRKPDAKSGTIAEDPDYKAFLAACEQPDDAAPPSWEQTLEEIEKRHSELKESTAVTPLVTFVCKRRAERKEERRRREVDRRKEEIRKAREKLLAKEKRETREKSRYESKESSKALREEEKDRKRDDGPTTKKHEDKPKEKYGKEYTKEKHGKEASKSDKDDKYKRKDKEERWKDSDKSKRDDKTRHGREERRKDTDWEDRKKRTDKKLRASDSSSEVSGASGKERAVEGRDASERAAEARGGGDAADAARAPDGARSAPGKKDAAETRKERRDPKGDRVKTGLKNKDRPSLTIYRPGMGKYSSRRLQERDSQSSSPPPTAEGGGGEDEERQRAAPPRTLVFRRSRAAE